MAGQTISDRFLAAKYSLAGQGLAKSVCKATTEELLGPKKKHLDYLIHCTNEPNVSIPQLANLLIERSQSPIWVVVFKALITVHHLMCYGNERFTQYLASSNSTFQLSNFLDKGGPHGIEQRGYDMSPFIRRYARYMNEKALSYRTVAFDFCKVKRGKEDGVLRTMNAEKLLKTLPVLQSQLDALLEFDCTAADLSNGVINTAFMLLFRDLIRLFAGYNDSIINLLEKYFDMNKKQCREALDLYKKFLIRMDRVGEFLKVAENVGIDKGEIPDLTKAPSSLLEALEQHLAALEGKKSAASTPTQAVTQQRSDVKTGVTALSSTSSAFGTAAAAQKVDAPVDETVAKQIVAEEEAILNQYKAKVQSPVSVGSAATNPFLSSPTQPIVDLFAVPATSSQTATSQSKALDDLLQLGNPFADAFSAQPAAPSIANSQPTNNMWMTTNGFSHSVNTMNGNANLTNAFVDDRSFTSVFGDSTTNHHSITAAQIGGSDLDIFVGKDVIGGGGGGFAAQSITNETMYSDQYPKLQAGSSLAAGAAPPPRPPPPSASSSRAMSPTSGASKSAMDDLNDSIRTALGNSPSYNMAPAAPDLSQTQQQQVQGYPLGSSPYAPGMMQSQVYGSPIKYPSVLTAGANNAMLGSAASTTTTNKVLTGDLESSLASLAENLTINKTNQQPKPMQWNSPKNAGGKIGVGTSGMWNPQPMAATTGANYRPMGMPVSNMSAAHPIMGMQGMPQGARMQVPATGGMMMTAQGLPNQAANMSSTNTPDPFGAL